MHVISGYLRNDEDLRGAASGGLSTALVQQMINNHGVVYGVKYADDFYSARYTRIETHNEIKGIMGSKYIRASLIMDNGQNTYDACCEDLINGQKVLFIGLPCEISALKKRVLERSINSAKLYTVDLICHGPTSPSVQKQFIQMLEKKYNSKVVGINTRYKNPNWGVAYLHIVTQNGQEYTEKLNETEFGIAFNMMPQPCAFHCKFKGENYCSDMTIGDYWGVDSTYPEYNPFGVSIGFDHTGRIFDILDNKIFEMYEADEHNARSHNPRYDKPLQFGRDHKHFKKLYDKYGLEFACVHRYSLLTKLKKILCKK